MTSGQDPNVNPEERVVGQSCKPANNPVDTRLRQSQKARRNFFACSSKEVYLNRPTCLSLSAYTNYITTAPHRRERQTDGENEVRCCHPTLVPNRRREGTSPAYFIPLPPTHWPPVGRPSPSTPRVSPPKLPRYLGRGALSTSPW